MGLPCSLSNIRIVPKLMKLVVSYILSLFLFSHLKHAINHFLGNAILSLLKQDMAEQYVYDEFEARPRGPNSSDRASLVPVPAHFFAEAVKKRLPVMPYKSCTYYNNNKDCVCIVCLSKVEESQEVRVLSNCCHVFHRECLDVWIDQGQGTCPLCRSKLLPNNHDHDHHDHPWRRERLIYLFGDEYYLFDHEEMVNIRD